MTEQRRRYAIARMVFGVLFILSACVLVIYIATRDRDTGGMGVTEPEESNRAVEIISLITSSASVIAFVSTTLLEWREEKREAEVAELQRQRQALEIERMRLELERLKAEKEGKAGEE